LKNIFIILFLIVGCSNSKKKEEPLGLEYFKAKKEIYSNLISSTEEITARCDGLTFIGLYDAYMHITTIYEWEYSVKDGKKIPLTGQWHRDKDECFTKDLDGDGQTDSRSEISLEGVLGAIHALWARKDVDGLRRLKSFAEASKWTFGDGPAEYTYLPQLTFIISRAVDELSLNKDLVEDDSFNTLLKGYRGKVLADYIDIKGKIYGYLNPLELASLKSLNEEDPKNPIYEALLCRYNEENKSNCDSAKDLLSDENKWPPGALPEKDPTGWADSPAGAAVVYSWIVSILTM
jgi:hypothetical protein